MQRFWFILLLLAPLALQTPAQSTPASGTPLITQVVLGNIMRFQLAPGDTLMLLSDGVAEAQNEHGHLFGFERVHDLLQKPITAAEVANAAQAFGQHDDISVLRIVRDLKVAERKEAEPVLVTG